MNDNVICVILDDLILFARSEKYILNSWMSSHSWSLETRLMDLYESLDINQDRQFRSGEVVAPDLVTYEVGEQRSRKRVLDLMLDKQREKVGLGRVLSMPFSRTNASWIKDVTGVDISEVGEWTDWELDEQILPTDRFRVVYEDTLSAFVFGVEAGRRTILDSFLRDVIMRPEFRGKLAVYPELYATATNGTQSIRGYIDYTVGLKIYPGQFYRTSVPLNHHLVSVEAKASLTDSDLVQCMAEMACIFHSHSPSEDRRVWGVLSDGEFWKFLELDNSKRIRSTRIFSLDLSGWDEDAVKQIYRFLHFVILNCYRSLLKTHPEHFVEV